jgi:hypothetical protein
MVFLSLRPSMLLALGDFALPSLAASGGRHPGDGRDNDNDDVEARGDDNGNCF